MDFSSDIWLLLFVEIIWSHKTTAKLRRCAWHRFVAHPLFDRKLLLCIERARCTKLHISHAMVDYLGPWHEKSGFWFSTRNSWEVHVRQCWQPSLLREHAVLFARWLPKPMFDYVNQTWITLITNEIAFYTPLGERKRVVTFAGSTWCARSATMDVASRRIFVVGSGQLHMLDADGNILQCIACPIFSNHAIFMALDPIRRRVHVMSDAYHVIDWNDAAAITHRTLRMLCSPAAIKLIPLCVVVHAPTGMMAHINHEGAICVHDANAHHIRCCRKANRRTHIMDMFIHTSMDVLFVAEAQTIHLVSCSTVFAKPDGTFAPVVF